MNASVTISVIIPTHRRNKQVVQLIETLIEQEFGKEKFEVLVIGNLYSRQLETMIYRYQSQFQPISYFHTGTIGVNAARNLGILKSKGEFLCFLDDDCILTDKHYLRKIVLYQRKYPTIIGIGGRYEFSPSYFSIVAQAYHLISDFWLISSKIDWNQTRNLLGGNSSYKAEVIKTNNFLFDNKIRFGGAETDFNSRLISKGFQLLWVEDLPVTHDIRLSLVGLAKKAFKQGLAAAEREKTINCSKKNNYWNVSSFQIYLDQKYLGRVRSFFILKCWKIYNYWFHRGFIFSKRGSYARFFLTSLLLLVRGPFQKGWGSVIFSDLYFLFKYNSGFFSKRSVNLRNIPSD